MNEKIVQEVTCTRQDLDLAGRTYLVVIYQSHMHHYSWQSKPGSCVLTALFTHHTINVCSIIACKIVLKSADLIMSPGLMQRFCFVLDERVGLGQLGRQVSPSHPV